MSVWPTATSARPRDRCSRRRLSPALWGAKRTHDLIPFCHPLGLLNCKINIELDEDNNAVIDCRCKVRHRTGVEMEALTGASIAALTVYDMCKALSHDIVIRETRLIAKTGGKQDFRHEG